MEPDELDIVCSETVTNGHIEVRVHMRQNGEVIITSKADQDWEMNVGLRRGDMCIVVGSDANFARKVKAFSG